MVRIEPTLGAAATAHNDGDVTTFSAVADSQVAEDVERVISNLVGDSDTERADAPQTLRFDSIRQAVELARRLAIENYMQHVNHLIAARNDEERAAATAGLVEAERATRLADKAAQQLIDSEASFRGATLFLVRGEKDRATQASEDSAMKMGQVAANLDAFGSMAPRSKFFGAAVRVVASADGVLSRVERRIEQISASLNAFAARVRGFARVIASAPRVAEQVAHEHRVAMTEASLRVSRSLLAGARGWASSRVAKAQDVAERAKRSAWDMLVAVKLQAEAAANAVTDHSRALAGLVGTAIGAAAEAYKVELGVAQATRAKTGMS